MRIITGRKLSVQLIAVFFALAIVPMVTLWVYFYDITTKEMIHQAQAGLTDSVTQIGALVDNKLGGLNESARLLNIDNELYRVFSRIDPGSDLSILEGNKVIRTVLPTYFEAAKDIYSVHVVTSYYRFGDNESEKNFYPEGAFSGSMLADAAYEAGGKLTWVPTYDYVRTFGVAGLSSDRLDYGYLFSAVKLLNVSTVREGAIRRMPASAELPVLVINFKPSFFDDVFASFSDSRKEEYEYLVVSRGGDVVAGSAAYPAATRVTAGWILDVGGSGSGSLIHQVDGEDRIISYAVSEVTGWIVAVIVPQQEFTSVISRGTRNFMLLSLPVISLLSLALFYLYSNNFSRRIHSLLKLIDRIGRGDFSTPYHYDSKEEFGFFYQKLNEMNQSIGRLIKEKYEAELNRQKLEIMVLNVQLNPHFLYNTLNTINWLCLSGDTQKTSEMIVGLSRMLYYTSDNRSEYAKLRDDLDWLKKYVFIMQMRYEGSFEVRFEVDPAMLELTVPKLFLQPLVENAIIHGLQGLDRPGLLRVGAACRGADMLFSVEDNGLGMTREKIEAVLAEESDSIGLFNMNRRLRMQYGQRYTLDVQSAPDTGTIVTIRIGSGRDASSKNTENLR